MQMLSEDDRNIKDMPQKELDAAWDLWFDLAQYTNDFDAPYSHGVFAGRDSEAAKPYGANGLRTVSRPSMTWPDCKSSE
jgi:hypothetical protein